eukprot:TRINITY_DN7162_c0_g1_i1.p1 TRINITY_DN7162_c0_g1~~TRINITY_DN7162_c0_g1_i1.p1  ORF type:complete len:816 (+),score=291.80 TRINITY_DN7162_c0_g1_i1:99-2546(+)
MAWFTAGFQSLIVEALLTLVTLVAAWLLRRMAASKRSPPMKKQKAKMQQHYYDDDEPRAAKRSKAVPAPPSKPAAKPDAAAAAAAFSEPNVLITAIRKGRVSELPYLLDAACDRAAQKAGNDQQAFEEEANDHLLRVLRTCAASQHYTAAIKAYDHMKDRIGEGNTATWSLMLYNAAECGENALGMEFYRKIEALDVPSSQDFVNVVRCVAHSKDMHAMRQILRSAEVCKVQLDATTRNRALAACCLEGALELGEAIAKSDCFSQPMDAVGINTLMKGFARMGKLKRCLELQEEMAQKGVAATEMTFGILLDACITARDYDQAMQICESIKGKGLRLNKIHMTTVIKGLASSGEMDKADALLRDMKGTMNIEPDIVTYQTLVKAHVERGDLDAALLLFKDMAAQDLQPDALIVDCVLGGCCHPDTSEARIIAVFDALADRNAKPSVGAVNLLVRSLAQNKAWEAAFDFLQRMQKRFGMATTPNLHAQLGLACVKAGDMATARKVCDAVMASEDFDKFVSCRLLQQCVKTGDLSEAKSVAFGGAASMATLTEGDKNAVPNGSSSVPLELLMACSSSLAQRLSLGQQDARMAQFISANHLDVQSAQQLSTLPPAMAEWVMDQGFLLKGGDRQAIIAERIREAGEVAPENAKFWEAYPDAAGLKKRMQDFIDVNSLDQRCVDTLKRLSRQQALWVMDQEFLVNVDPSKGTAAAKVISSIRKAWNSAKSNQQLPDRRYATAPQGLSGAAAVALALDDFIQLNRLDDRCSRLLRSLPPADAAWVMDQEFRIAVNPSKGTASAKVVGLVNKARTAGIGSMK